MSGEVKQRKRTQKPSDEPASIRDEEQKNSTVMANKTSGLDLKTIISVFCLATCAALSWLVLQQNERLSKIEETYSFLHGKTFNLVEMEEEVVKVSKKLAASEDDLREALSIVSLATTLQQDVSDLHGKVAAIRADENAASRDLQAVNAQFLNVTETWQKRLAATTSDLVALKMESREAHAEATEKVNEVERRAKTLGEKLEELGDSTKRNARALERTEEDDAKRAREHLDWNTKQIHKLEEQIGGLARREAELSAQLQEHVPRARECEENLPRVEEAVRSILRLGGDLSSAEKRLEELTLQVFGTEDSMLKAVGEILDIRQELDTLQAQNSILKMKNELSVVKEAVSELTMVLRGSQGQRQPESMAAEEEEWNDEMEEEEEEEEWEPYDQEEPSQPLNDDK